MTRGSDEELRALRARAYGPGADIHLDAGALERLRELEGEGRESQPPVVDDASEPEAATLEQEDEPPARHWLEPLSRIRRSTVLLVLGVAVIGAIIAVSPALVERVQGDPLQIGADQVARLTADPGYEVPSIFSGSRSSTGSTSEGFELFYGLRVVHAQYSALASGPDDECLILYVDADIGDPDSNSFSGPAFNGCSAAGFPATVQFVTTTDGLPDELTAAFPGSPALQFVYDSDHDEVVVFAEQPDGSR
ncbi:hypothetical protein IWX81_001425 [Salinibacterium sp. CAN_S4]|uniref:hypothetical protein n=1 Tax=Salinibacterium sp. CAN_S4 TaxID=2787727 RepID=UPI0018EFF0F8